MLMAAEYSASQGLASRAAALSNGFIQLKPEDLEKNGNTWGKQLRKIDARKFKLKQCKNGDVR
jgi:hypothetical protein